MVYAVIGILAVVVIALLIKLYLMKKSAREISVQFADILQADTNAVIRLSSYDKDMRLLADDLNKQLRILRKAQHRYLQGDKELKEAITNISHDLRTPLTAICGYLNLLENEQKTQETERYLSIISERIETMKSLTEELFGYSVIVAPESSCTKEQVVLNDVLEESIAAFYATLSERGISPTIQIPEQNIVRTLDRSALARVFSNLLNNAIKYSDGDLEISLTQTGQITFSNTTKSLTAVQVGKLFDRFYTVESARNSTGLGLSIAKTLVDRMGGTIYAEYESSKLRIHIAFPAE